MSVVEELVPLGLDQHQEEVVLTFRNPDTGWYMTTSRRRGATAWIEVCHPRDAAAFLERRRNNGWDGVLSSRSDYDLTATTISEILKNPPRLTPASGKPVTAIWFPISGEVIPL